MDTYKFNANLSNEFLSEEHLGEGRNNAYLLDFICFANMMKVEMQDFEAPKESKTPAKEGSLQGVCNG